MDTERFNRAADTFWRIFYLVTATLMFVFGLVAILDGSWGWAAFYMLSTGLCAVGYRLERS